MDRNRWPVLVGCVSVLGLLLVASVWADDGTDRARELTQQARSQYAAGQTSRAIELLEEALALCPTYTAAQPLLAVAYQTAGDVDKAMEHYWAAQRASFPTPAINASESSLRTRELLVQTESLLVMLANRDRLEQKLRPLLPDPVLARIARQHSDEMRDLKYFSHESPTDGFKTINDRFRRVVTPTGAWAIAENIAQRYAEGMYSLTLPNAKRTHGDWMMSAGHKANLLSPELEKLGVGIAVNEKGDYWATEFFATY